MSEETKAAKPTKTAATKSTSIYKKLLEFQSQNISVCKGKENPHFKNKYADINEILEKVKPPLSKLGVVITQVPTSEGLKTILHDTESETEIEGYLEFCQRTDAQKLGSNITYYRRYSLLAMLGLEDEDDDGNKAAASAAAPASRPAKRPELTIEQACLKLRTANNLDELKAIFLSLPTHLKKDNEVTAMKDELKGALNF